MGLTLAYGLKAIQNRMNKFFNKNQLNKVFVSVFHLACNAYFMKITLCLRTIKGAIWSYVYG